MNRRSFLLGVGAAACTGPTAAKRPTSQKLTPPPVKPPPVHDLAYRASQLAASAIALRGKTLIQIANDELRELDAVTMKRVDAWNLRPKHACFLQDGTIAAFSLPGSGESTVYRLGAGRNLETLHGPIFIESGRSVLLPGRTPAEVYVTDGERIVPLELVGTRAEDGDPFAHPNPNVGNRDQLFSRGDGRLVVLDREGGIRVLSPGTAGVRYPMPGRTPLHLVAGSGEQLWYSYAPGAEDWNATILALARVNAPEKAVVQHDVSPGRIIHLASGGGAAAALVMTVAGPGDGQWSIVVVEERGAVRWRADVPQSFRRGALGSAGFIAISDQRVVVAGLEHTLMAWDAATGKPV